MDVVWMLSSCKGDVNGSLGWRGRMQKGEWTEPEAARACAGGKHVVSGEEMVLDELNFFFLFLCEFSWAVMKRLEGWS